jgi:hypothetical protein
MPVAGGSNQHEENRRQPEFTAAIDQHQGS